VNETTTDQSSGQVARITARVYRNGACIGRVQYVSDLSPAKLRGYRAAMRYGCVRVTDNGVVVDAQYR
jgi:hypothetical protein